MKLAYYLIKKSTLKLFHLKPKSHTLKYLKILEIFRNVILEYENSSEIPRNSCKSCSR